MSMAYVAVAVAVIGAGLSAYSSYAAGENAKEAADFNADMQRRSALDALQRGSIAAAEHRSKVRQIMAQQATGSAASGVNIDSGTPLQLITESAGVGELDALRILNNAQRQAYGMNAQAELDVFQGRSARSTGMMNAGASLLSGASNAYYSYRAASAKSKE